MPDTQSEKTAEQLEELAASPELVEALESERFKQFLDHMPVAILVSEIRSANAERIVYANHEAELVLGAAFSDVEGCDWSRLDEIVEGKTRPNFTEAIFDDRMAAGVLVLRSANGSPGRHVELQTAIAADETDRERFRLVALIDVTERSEPQRQAFELQLRDKDLLLQEIQHRVKNNLQIVTALIRMEARRAGSQIGTGPFERLAGRIEALGLLYKQLALDEGSATVDLGSLLSQIVGSVMGAQAPEGIKLDLQVEACLAGIDVAMSVGLLVNELLTNAMKYAFDGRTEGVVSVRCLKDDQNNCVISVSDDGVGMPDGVTWPQPGKLGSLMVRSLMDNAKGTIETAASPQGGVMTTIRFPLPASTS